MTGRRHKPRSREAGIREWHRERKRREYMARNGPVEERAEAVALALLEHGELKVKELAELLSMSPAALSPALSRLNEDGRARRKGKRWRIVRS